MKPTRKTQPMRKVKGSARTLSMALQSATKGATSNGANPMDSKRALEKQAKRGSSNVRGVPDNGLESAKRGKRRGRPSGGLAGRVKRATNPKRSLY